VVSVAKEGFEPVSAESDATLRRGRNDSKDGPLEG
jgi:hypothetical protein